jgi:N-ethylmaleimide reductase
MKTVSADKLFTPIQVGPMELKHRVVMAPLTRSRSVQPGSIPGNLMLEYYSQRASDGGLIVSEGTSISIAGGGAKGTLQPRGCERFSREGLLRRGVLNLTLPRLLLFGAPGMYSDEQVGGWKRITNAVHAKRGYMFSQLWHTGRASHVDSTRG